MNKRKKIILGKLTPNIENISLSLSFFQTFFNDYTFEEQKGIVNTYLSSKFITQECLSIIIKNKQLINDTEIRKNIFERCFEDYYILRVFCDNVKLTNNEIDCIIEKSKDNLTDLNKIYNIIKHKLNKNQKNRIYDFLSNSAMISNYILRNENKGYFKSEIYLKLLMAVCENPRIASCFYIDKKNTLLFKHKQLLINSICKDTFEIYSFLQENKNIDYKTKLLMIKSISENENHLEDFLRNYEQPISIKELEIIVESIYKNLWIDCANILLRRINNQKNINYLKEKLNATIVTNNLINT